MRFGHFATRPKGISYNNSLNLSLVLVTQLMSKYYHCRASKCGHMDHLDICKNRNKLVSKFKYILDAIDLEGLFKSNASLSFRRH